MMKKIKELWKLLRTAYYLPITFLIGKGEFEIGLLKIVNIEKQTEIIGALIGIGLKETNYAFYQGKALVIHLFWQRMEITIEVKFKSSVEFTPDANKAKPASGDTNGYKRRRTS